MENIKKPNIPLLMNLEYQQSVPWRVKYLPTPKPAFRVVGEKENMKYHKIEVLKEPEHEKIEVLKEPEYKNTIPYLIRAVEDVRGGKDKIKEMEKCLLKFGFLTTGNTGKETLEDFWREAEEFEKLWGYYQQVLSRDVIGLKKWITAVRVPSEGIVCMIVNSDFKEIPPLKTGNKMEELANLFNIKFNTKVTYRLEDFDESPLQAYKTPAFQYIVETVIERIGAIQIQPTTIHCEIDTFNEQDKFTVSCKPHCDNLLQALYFKFFQLLQGNDGQKICKGCGDIFTPSRPNNEYCTSKCRATTKRRMARKNASNKKDSDV